MHICMYIYTYIYIYIYMITKFETRYWGRNSIERLATPFSASQSTRSHFRLAIETHRTFKIV